MVENVPMVNVMTWPCEGEISLCEYASQMVCYLHRIVSENMFALDKHFEVRLPSNTFFNRPFSQSPFISPFECLVVISSIKTSRVLKNNSSEEHMLNRHFFSKGSELFLNFRREPFICHRLNEVMHNGGWRVFVWWTWVPNDKHSDVIKAQ